MATTSVNNELRIFVVLFFDMLRSRIVVFLQVAEVMAPARLWRAQVIHGFG
jgi:hypothetical protein